MKTERKKRNFRHIVIIILLVLAFLIAMFAVSRGYFSQLLGPQICTSTQCFKLEIADTPQTREIGLMHRTSLDSDKGMLFVFDQPGQYSFRMKNTLIPLDILRLNAKYKILYIQHMAQPCTADPCPTYNPGIDASYVLELNGGITQDIGIYVGEGMTFKK